MVSNKVNTSLRVWPKKNKKNNDLVKSGNSVGSATIQKCSLTAVLWLRTNKPNKQKKTLAHALTGSLSRLGVTCSCSSNNV